MLLTKTSLAHDALQAGPGASLGLPERRVLILADGKRSLNDVVALLGADSLSVVTRLLQAGYLRDGSKADPTPSARPATQGGGVAGALTGLLRATTEAMQARTDALRTGNVREPLAAPPPAAPPIPAPIPARTAMPAAPAPAASRQRRSMVAAKMYMVDMLQLQRHPDAVDLKARIQCCNDQDELLVLLLEAAQALRRLTSESFGARIVARLREVLPEEALPALEQAFRPLAADAAEPALPRIRLVGS
ncbi:hypothetical protein MASR1M8_07930 [Thermomonas brevis]